MILGQLVIQFVKYPDPENPNLMFADWLELRPTYGTYPEDKETTYQATLDSLAGLLEPGGWVFYSARVEPEQPVTGQMTPTEA
jgi:hypothetical protein